MVGATRASGAGDLVAFGSLRPAAMPAGRSVADRYQARDLATRVVATWAMRQNRGVRVERHRENVFTVTATGRNLSSSPGARLALDAMRASPDAPATAIELLGRVLEDFDRSRERLSETPPNGYWR